MDNLSDTRLRGDRNVGNRLRFAMHPHRLMALLLVGLVVGGLALSITDQRADAAATRSDRFWSGFWANGTFQSFDNAEQAIAASDTVVVATIRKVEAGRSVDAISGWGKDGVLQFARVELVVERVVHGTYVKNVDGGLNLELFLPDPGALDGVRSSVPGERGIYFLAESPSGGAGVYALRNPEAVIRDIRGSEPLPFAEEAWLSGLRGTGFQVILDKILSAANGA